MTHAESVLAHLEQQREAAVATLEYVRRHASNAAREHAAAPSPETRCAVANAQASMKSAATALGQATMRLADQALAVDMEKIAAKKPVSP